uniref:Uncharacterized protein n=1 Tax=Chromera velia CCMP2878 TaxID=1169474 RepID=A0A0K6S8U8_9ALVE|eukprot:Cvel_6410.t2-p1 / transcript=Cvel_6410.t2 / gene=Cvel_6410 / organism=Chromera_velia_CCMP2878 / gene_product=hypothetical protein / transcript_product=hypothetical protein / location=Cvel_scaffold313:52034-55663(-) / protein_length=240 / sequence_SO=supercontig / SO=protein_coding / is_pseudo=false
MQGKEMSPRLCPDESPDTPRENLPLCGTVHIISTSGVWMHVHEKTSRRPCARAWAWRLLGDSVEVSDQAEKKEADSSEIMDSKPVSEDSYLDAVFAAPTLQSESSERQLAAPMTSKSGEIPPELGVSSKELIQFGDRTGVMTFSNENMPWLSTWSFAWGIHDGKGGQYLAAAHICSYDCWSSHLEDGSDEAALTNRTGWCKKEDCFAQFGGSKRQNSTALVESVSFFSHLVQPALRAGPQ